MSRSLRIDTNTGGRDEPEESKDANAATLLDRISTLSETISNEYAAVERITEPKNTNTSNNSSAHASSRPSHSRKNTATGKADLSGSTPLPSTPEVDKNQKATDRNIKSNESLENEFKLRRESADVIFTKVRYPLPVN